MINQKWIILALVLLIGAVIYGGTLRPTTILSGDKMDIEGGREVNGKWVEGWWVYTLTIDSADSYISFDLKDLEVPHPTDPDAEIRSGGTARVVLTRYTPYMISYPVYKAYHGIWNDFWDWGTGFPPYADTADAFYRVMGFSSTVCPYKVDLYKDGSFIDSEIGVAGDPTSVSWSTMSFTVGDYPYEAKIKDIGLMSKGLTIPVVDLAVDYTTSGYARCFSITDHDSEVSAFSSWTGQNLIGQWEYKWLWESGWLGGLQQAPGITLWGTDDRYKLKGMPSNVGLIDLSRPSDGQLWSKIDAPYDMQGCQTKTDETGLIVAAERPDYTSATITLRVRSELVESWVWHEPRDIPKILEPIATVHATGASTAVATIRVQNVGTGAGTFVISVQPTNAWCSGVSPREQNIDPGETGTFYATLDIQDVKQFVSEQVFVKATAMGSGETDTAYFTLEIEPKPEPNGDGVGRVSGTVIDSETKGGIPHAKAVVGGEMAESDSAGSFLVDGVPVGVWTLTISADEYEGWQTTVNVSKDATTKIGTIELTRVATDGNGGDGEDGDWWDEYGIYVIVGIFAIVLLILLMKVL